MQPPEWPEKVETSSMPVFFFFFFVSGVHLQKIPFGDFVDDLFSFRSAGCVQTVLSGFFYLNSTAWEWLGIGFFF